MSRLKGITSNSPWPNGHGGNPGGGDQETNPTRINADDGGRAPPSSSRRPHLGNKGENNFNFIQINLNRARQATCDLASYVCHIRNPVILAQEPNTSGKYKITPLSTDMCTYSMDGGNVRPRAYIFVPKNVRHRFWLVDSLSDSDCITVRTKFNNTEVLLVSCYMDRGDTNCPPTTIRNIINHAKSNKLAVIIGTDANAHSDVWNSYSINDNGRGNKLVDFIFQENINCENVGTDPTFDNGRWKNIIDLTLTNDLGHSMVDKWHVDMVESNINSSDHNYIRFSIPDNSLSKKKELQRHQQD